MPLLPQVLFVLSLALALPVSAAQPEPAAREWLRSGPMPGVADIQGTVLWLQTRDPRSVVVRYWPEGEPEAARLGPSVETGPAGDHIAKITLSGLRFGTVYRYELYLDGHRVASPDPDEPWRFHTQAMWRWRTDPPSFTFAIGSCAYVNDPPFDRPGKPYGSEFEIFDQVADQRPAFMLWLGDNIYLKDADWLSEQGIRHRYAQNRELPELQRLLAATHHLAIWDDHDYGSDNSDRTFPLRDASLEIFREYWANPSMGTRELPGAFGRFEWHDVEFFLLDDRFHRTPNAWPAGPDKVMYGAAQMRWLKESLLSSQATFKIVAGGNQFLNPMLYDPSWQELWEMFPDEKQDFLEFLTNSQVEGVLFLSGDRHHSELLKLEGALPALRIHLELAYRRHRLPQERNRQPDPRPRHLGHLPAQFRLDHRRRPQRRSRAPAPRPRARRHRAMEPPDFATGAGGRERPGSSAALTCYDHATEVPRCVS